MPQAACCGIYATFPMVHGVTLGAATPYLPPQEKRMYA